MPLHPNRRAMSVKPSNVSLSDLFDNFEMMLSITPREPISSSRKELNFKAKEYVPTPPAINENESFAFNAMHINAENVLRPNLVHRQRQMVKAPQQTQPQPQILQPRYLTKKVPPKLIQIRVKSNDSNARSSSYAPRGRGSASGQLGQRNFLSTQFRAGMKRGDWICTFCDYHNFANNWSCRECKKLNHTLKIGDWLCPLFNCGYINFAKNKFCRKCTITPRPPIGEGNVMQMHKLGQLQNAPLQNGFGRGQSRGRGRKVRGRGRGRGRARGRGRGRKRAFAPQTAFRIEEKMKNQMQQNGGFGNEAKGKKVFEDWMCRQCHYVNFESNGSCRQCCQLKENCKQIE